MNKILITLSLFLVTTLIAHESYWKGQIGDSKIYLELNCDITKEQKEKNSCRFSRYFYESQLQDIIMARGGEISKNRYRLQVIHADKVVEEFLLEHTHGILQGSWKSDGKNLQVLLKRIPLDHSSNDAFEKLRTQFLDYKRKKIETLEEQHKEFVWIEESHSKSSLFRLGNGFSKTSREHLNPLLDELQNTFSTSTLSCATSYEYGTGMREIKALGTYLSEDLIGFECMLDYFCGGAYPDFYTRRYLYDLHSGKRYRLDEILTIAKEPSKIRDLAFKAKGKERKPSKDDLPSEGYDHYDPYDLHHWQNIGWEYGKYGIRFFLQFRTYERCFRGDSYFVPFALLKPYKNKSFPYPFGK